MKGPEPVDPAPSSKNDKVILTRRREKGRGRLALIVLLIVLFGVALFMVLISSIAWDLFGPAVTLATIGAIFLAFSPLFYLSWRLGRRHVLTKTIVLDTDRISARSDRGVLDEIAFDSSVRVDAETSGTEGDHPFGYTFSKGWSGPIQVTNHDYSDEDLERMWPVLRAAIRKHGMEADVSIRMLIEEEG